MFFPATACLVQHKLGAQNVWGFDLSAGCSQFVYALQVGAQFVQTGAHKKVMVIGADVMSSIIDYTDRATCVIFGDGAGAVILLEPAEDDSLGLIDFLHEVDGSGGVRSTCPAAAA
jgi:3-oxoacyl-[acyl-carrier-protein] synthase III